MSGRHVSSGAFFFSLKCVMKGRRSAKREGCETEVQYAAYVQTAVSVIDVAPVCHLADHFQVHSSVGMDDGFPGGEAKEPLKTHMGKTLCRAGKLYQGIWGPDV